MGGTNSDLRSSTLLDQADDVETDSILFDHTKDQHKQQSIYIPPDGNETAGQLTVDYPLSFPQNPHMRGQAQREQTFDRRWPAGTIRATPAQIAEAGFFYLGKRDQVKCWHCNGGLQNWELDDIPWDEHSKRFPNCQFLLRTKGQQFVSQHSRHIVSRQDGSTLNPVGTSHIGSVRGPGIPLSVVRHRSLNPPLTIIDPQEELRKRKERVKNIMKNSEVVKNVLAMGFAKTINEDEERKQEEDDYDDDYDDDERRQEEEEYEVGRQEEDDYDDSDDDDEEVRQEKEEEKRQEEEEEERRQEEEEQEEEEEEEEEKRRQEEDERRQEEEDEYEIRRQEEDGDEERIQEEDEDEERKQEEDDYDDDYDDDERRQEEEEYEVGRQEEDEDEVIRQEEDDYDDDDDERRQEEDEDEG